MDMDMTPKPTPFDELCGWLEKRSNEEKNHSKTITIPSLADDEILMLWGAISRMESGVTMALSVSTSKSGNKLNVAGQLLDQIKKMIMEKKLRKCVSTDLARKITLKI